MTLPIDPDDEGYRFYKTLNEDIELKQDIYGQWDMEFQNGDIVNLTGHESLKNAIYIAIMTRYKELKRNPLYNEFGCRIHELIKARKRSFVRYKIELFIEEVLENMRRVKKVNWIEVQDSLDRDMSKYHVTFSVTSIIDEVVEGEILL